MNVKMCESHRAYFLLLLSSSDPPPTTTPPPSRRVQFLVPWSHQQPSLEAACLFPPRFVDCVLLPRVSTPPGISTSSSVVACLQLVVSGHVSGEAVSPGLQTSCLVPSGRNTAGTAGALPSSTRTLDDRRFRTFPPGPSPRQR